MLTLTRNPGESIIVEDTTTPGRLLQVTVLEIDRGQVKLGIGAPQSFRIWRDELWDARNLRPFPSVVPARRPA